MVSLIHTVGYGVYTDEIKLDSVDCLRKLLSFAPKLNKDLQAEMKTQGIKLPEILDDYNIFCDSNDFAGLATILRAVIFETEGVTFYADRSGSKEFILYDAMQPWAMTRRDKKMNAQTVIKILEKYLSVLTDDPPKVRMICPVTEVKTID